MKGNHLKGLQKISNPALSLRNGILSSKLKLVSSMLVGEMLTRQAIIFGTIDVFDTLSHTVICSKKLHSYFQNYQLPIVMSLSIQNDR